MNGPSGCPSFAGNPSKFIGIRLEIVDMQSKRLVTARVLACPAFLSNVRKRHSMTSAVLFYPKPPYACSKTVKKVGIIHKNVHVDVKCDLK